ncbi:prenyltransferase/squalene oxidase repeat-containing protein [Glycomyces harbinensis]|uniref:Prenyltransferase and squalene oxidase repeat-containing protein n=1 Tax=Glycomyces harbinensis TaxID=58114 RepID=A0A1G7D7X5_9ACTN|nr:prenyltransferase/squalene oxidase repeat-containing protein [Glycomyces harbinensis]SDE47631.1 hypothetical protein SAMN05216270_12356 [Glycomyces harbinensis]
MRHLSGRLLAAAAVVPISVLASAVPAQAQSETFDAPAQAAASWLVSQSDGTSWSAGDVSTSLDAVIALQAAGVGGDHVKTTLEWLNDTETLTPYVYPAVEGAAEPVLSAGSAGKVMYAVATAGGDATDFAGIRLADEVTAAQTANGTYGDGTALSTAWAVLGLSRTDAPAGEEAAAGLAAVQCPDGGFSFGDIDGGDDCVSDPDSTGLVVSALATLPGDAASTSVESAVTWLESAQAENGGFDNGFGENANSTAMAAQAFFATERADAAERAVAYLLELQFDCAGTAPGAFMYTDPEDPEFGEATRLLATAQAMVPVSGQNLADLDASSIAADVPGDACAVADGGDATEAETEADADTAAWLPWAIGAAVLVLAALIIAFAVKARKNGENGAAPTDPDARAADVETDALATGEAPAADDATGTDSGLDDEPKGDEPGRDKQ